MAKKKHAVEEGAVVDVDDAVEEANEDTIEEAIEIAATEEVVDEVVEDPTGVMSIKITEPGRAFDDINGVSITAGEVGEFQAAQAEMLKKLGLAEDA